MRAVTCVPCLVAAITVAALSPAVVRAEALPTDELDGFLEPFEVVKVASQVPGVIDDVLVRRGDTVSKGQPIARLKSGVERVAVDLAKARVQFGERKRERNRDLVKRQLISAHEMDELETDIQLARLQLREATEKLELRTIVSPIDGVVSKRSRAAGEYVGEDEIVTVACVDPLNVEVTVPGVRFGTIAKGTRAEVRPEAPVGGTYTATVVIVDSVIDAASGTFGVRLELPNPGRKVPAGLKCRVRFPGK